MVVIKQGKGYAPIFSNGQLMFDDIDLMSMREIVARVVGIRWEIFWANSREFRSIAGSRRRQLE